MAVDWLTLSASVGSSVIGGGLIGGLVALKVARTESDDRQKVIALEREKWEHERSAPSRERVRLSAAEVSKFLTEQDAAVMGMWSAYRAFEHDPPEQWVHEMLLVAMSFSRRFDLLNELRLDLPKDLAVLVAQTYLAGSQCLRAVGPRHESHLPQEWFPQGTVDELYKAYVELQEPAVAQLRALIKSL